MSGKEFLMKRGVNIDKSLEFFGDMETYNDTLNDFLDEISDRLSQLEEYKKTADMENYATLVHSLKSEARYLGFDILGEIAYQQELKSKENDTAYVLEHFPELYQEVERVVQMAREYLGKEGPTINVERTVQTSVQNQTILIVDDSTIVRNFIQKAFHDTYNILIANDGNEAVSIINQNMDNHKIIGMLLDLNMPNVDGFAVLEYWKTNNLFSKIPVSIITGEASKEMIERVFQYPIVDVLNKPFNENDVKRIVERILLFQELE